MPVELHCVEELIHQSLPLCSLAVLLLLQLRTEVGVNVPKLEFSCCNVAWSCHTDANNLAAELHLLKAV